MGSVLPHLETLIDIKLLPILFVSDINECEEVAGICTNGDCQNLDGSFSCILNVSEKLPVNHIHLT